MTNRMRRLIPLALAGILAAGCTAQQTRPAAGQAGPEPAPVPQTGGVMPPVYQVGDQWSYSDGYGLKVSRIEGGLTRFERTDAPGQWIARRGLFKEESQSPSGYRQVVFRSDDPGRLFPLEKDKSVAYTREYLADGQLRVHRSSWLVEGQERITVPAGTFDCWIVTWRSRSTGSDWTGFERWWYSPKAKNFVRMEYQYGDAPASSRVLMSYQVM